MDAVFARENETGWAGKDGILIDSAAGYEAELTPETLLQAVQDRQDMEGRISEQDWLNDESGKIHKITLDDCEKVHGAVSDALDTVAELFPDDYILNVSSSGLDRPIVTDDDFRRALGTEIEAITPDCTFRGTLTGYTAEDFTIVTLGKYEKEKTINRNNKTKVQPYIGF